MKRLLLAILALILASLACATGSETPRPSLYPSATAQVTQTPFVVQVTTTPVDTPLPVIVQVTPTPRLLCVIALVSVHLRPSPSDQNYPVMVLPNGSRLSDLGGRSDKWLFVQFNDKQGWVHSDYVGDCNG